MALFKPATNDQAFLKAGIMGFTGSGKTFTGSMLAIGLIEHIKAKQVPCGPVMFLDTETGSDWVRDTFTEHQIDLMVAKTRSFTDLIPAINEAREAKAVLIIDSITHFWRELTESYARKKNRTRGLEFQDWAYLKQRWGEFTDAFVNSEVHIIMCGRAGYEYDFFQNDSGKRELEKTGIKMKAEAETGYEPSILILMERDMDIETKKVFRTAHVMKDRSRKLDGKSFKFYANDNPRKVIETFMPHIECLNLGGHHVGVDTSRSSEGSIPPGQKDPSSWVSTQKQIVLDNVKAIFVEHGLDGTSAQAKKDRQEKLKTHFGTLSWTEIEETYSLEKLKDGLDKLHTELNGAPFYMNPEQAA